MGLLGALLAPLPSLAQTVIQRSFVNSSFESPDLQNGGCRVYINEARVTGWTTTHPSAATENLNCNVLGGLGASPGPIMELWKTPRSSDSGGTVNAPDGTQIAELNAAQASRLYQPICLINGDRVTWDFSHRGRVVNAPDSTRFDIAQMVIGSTGVIARVGTSNTGAMAPGTPTATLGTITGSAAIAGNTTWRNYSGAFTYSGATGLSNIGFEAESTGSGSTGTGNLLDNVRVNLTPLVDFAKASSADLEGAQAGSPRLLPNRPVLRVNGTVATAFNLTVQVVGGTATRGVDYFTNTPAGTSPTITIPVPAGTYDGVSASSLFALPVYIAGNDTSGSPSGKVGAWDIQFALQQPGGNSPFLLMSNSVCGSAGQGTADYVINDDDGALVITKTAGTPAPVGGTASQYDIPYTVTVATSGTGTRNFTLTDTPAFSGNTTINALTSLSCVQSGGGTSNCGALLAVPQNSSGPWTLQSNQQFDGTGLSRTYSMTVRVTVNPGPSGQNVCSGSPGNGLYNAARVALTSGETFSASACQDTPGLAWVTLAKSLPSGRLDTSDQFQVRMNAGGIPVANGSVTTTAANSSPTTSRIALPAGSIVQFSEALKLNGTGEDQAPSNYYTALTCTNATSGSSTMLPSGPGTAQVSQRQWAEFLPAAGDDIRCTITNTPRPTTLQVAKLINGRAASTDQFSMSIARGVDVSQVTASTGGQASITPAAIRVAAGSVFTLSEAATSGSLANYTSTYSCTNTGDGGTAVPSTPTAGTSVNITPAVGDAISCTFVNTPITYSVSVAAGLGGTASCAPAVVNSGQVSVCTAVPLPNYSVASWGGDCAIAGASSTCTLSGVTSNKASTVSFVRNQVAVSISKTVTGAPAATGAPGSYGFTLVCDTGSYSGAITVAGTGTSGSTAVQVPQGATCSALQETSKAAAPANYRWGTETTAPPAGSINAGASGSITNPLLANDGTLTVTKNLTGQSFTSATNYPFVVTCASPVASYSGTISVPANGSSASTTVSIPAGSSSCQIAETLASRPVPPANYSWGDPSYAQPSQSGMEPGGAASGSITNPLVTANLTLAKVAATSPPTSPVAVAQGGVFTYAIAVTNSGPVASASNTTVVDQVPAGVSINQVTPGAGWLCRDAANNNLSGGIDPARPGPFDITCTLAAGVPGASPGNNTTLNVVTFGAIKTAGAAQSVTNSASIRTGDAICESAPATARCVSSATVQDASSPLLAIGKAASPDRVASGGTIIYAISVINSGSAASGAPTVITDSVPAGITINNVAPGAGWACVDGSNNAASGAVNLAGPTTVACTRVNGVPAATYDTAANTFTPTQETAVTLTATKTGVSDVTNTASITTGDARCSAGAQGCTASATVLDISAPALAITKTADKSSARQGEPVAFTLTVSNTGPVPSVAGVSVEDAVPAGLQVTGVTAGNGWTCAPGTGAGPLTISCTKGAGSVAAGAIDETVVTIAATKTDDNTVTNVARIAGGDPACGAGPVAARCSSSASISAAAPPVPVPAGPWWPIALLVSAAGAWALRRRWA